VLAGVRVLELCDVQAEYCGLLLAGLGAEVVKVEPPGGSPSRRMAPFYEDVEDPERSLFFWAYNRGKRSITLDADEEADRSRARELVLGADVLLDSGSGGKSRRDDFGLSGLEEELPGLILARMTPFGDTGPWSRFKACDLVHLALGGVTMNCGYDPAPDGRYDVPPIAPQLWHAYHIAGEQLAMGILAALYHRDRTGRGQSVSIAVHEAVAKNTELDVTHWIMSRRPLQRLTCRHAAPGISRVPTICMTKDGGWVIARWYEDEVSYARLADLLDSWGMAADLREVADDRDAPPAALGRIIPGATWSGGPGMTEAQSHRMEIVARFVRSFRYEDFPWQKCQAAGLMFAPLRKPHENALDPHWIARATYADIEHPELGRSFRYPTSKWISTSNSWSIGRRAPLLDEDRDSDGFSVRPAPANPARSVPPSRFALDGVRILDFTWFLASAGGTRFLTAFGAESIKVEWKGHPDTRFGAQAPVGGREARNKAEAPLEELLDAEMGGQFNHKNAGKRGISLNLRHPEGLAIAKRLVEISDVVAEGFTSGVMDRWGLGYDVQRELNPTVIYAQQSGAGTLGTYDVFRSVGPIANAITGLAQMSGLPEPAMPAGWGYSYLDWIGAYSFALAILGGLLHRERTGEGQWIDASQCESGLYFTGVPVLDWSANGREWSRHGNRSPYQPAAPHGIYRCAGDDRWIAIACGDEQEWRSLVEVAGRPDWATDPRFGDLAARYAHQNALDREIEVWTAPLDDYALMEALQAAGVPAGVCQNAEDRCTRDPQLAALEWLTEVTGTKIGRWPIPEVPLTLSETPAYIGGQIDRGAPLYGEDNEYVYGELLGISSRQQRALAEEGVI
jgi:crotonobetainyl-CoA:carnitine CoA-transferase CaiB-like acyl-CoA transferase